jgi:hypothetical protein
MNLILIKSNHIWSRVNSRWMTFIHIVWSFLIFMQFVLANNFNLLLKEFWSNTRFTNHFTEQLFHTNPCERTRTYFLAILHTNGSTARECVVVSFKVFSWYKFKARFRTSSFWRRCRGLCADLVVNLVVWSFLTREEVICFISLVFLLFITCAFDVFVLVVFAGIFL